MLLRSTTQYYVVLVLPVLVLLLLLLVLWGTGRAMVGDHTMGVGGGGDQERATRTHI